MISYAEVRLAEWVIKQACKDGSMCHYCEICAHYELCHIQGHNEAPSDWNITNPPPEPTERPRIEWLRKLPDGEMLLSIEPVFKCADCQWKGEDCCNNDDMTCNNGHMDWWHEVVTLDRFRKDVGLP